MTKEEYDKQMKVLKDEFKNKKAELNAKYALDNNPFGDGDIIKGPGGIIKIDTIGICFTLCEKYPECHYYGIKLTKKLVPSKTKYRGDLYQSSCVLVKKADK